MSISNELELLLYLLPILTCFMAAFTLWVNPNRTRPQMWLALFMLMLGLTLSFTFSYDRYFSDFWRTALLPGYYVMSIFSAITVLFYFVSLMQPLRLTGRYIGYFVCAGVAYAVIMYLPLIFGWGGAHDKAGFRIFAAVCDASLIAYTITTVTAMYFRYRRFIRNAYSYAEGIGLRWIFISNGALALLGVIDIIWKLRADTGESPLFNLNVLIITILVFWLGFRQGEVPATPIPEAASDNLPTENLPAGQQSARYKLARQTLVDHFAEHKPYLDPTLSLDDTAAALGIKSGYLSRMINREFNVNFYTLVNGYRTDHAMELIERHNGRISIREAYTEAGFRSRSVFYSQFLSRTGQTPSEAIRKAQEKK